jgi:septum site-determining protein MinD
MKIITVASAKGGVGKSTFCCAMGKLMASKGKRVLLVDMDIGVRSLDILLGVSEKTVYNWGDILKGNCEYRKAVIETEKELFLLPAPVDFSEDYSKEKFKEMIKSFEKDFDVIFLDSPAGLESGFLLASDASDTCIIVTTPDAISIRAASYAAQNVKKSGVKDVRLVVNKFNKKIHKDINIDDYIDTVGARFLGVVPESTEVYQFVNGKKIPYDCKGNQAFLRISQRISGQNVPFKTRLL